MAQETTVRQFVRVTAKNLSALLEALPKAVANTVKRAVLKDWRRDEAEEAKVEERRAELVNGMPMGYTLFYESSDGKLCLYQDKDGHLVAADTSKFV